MVVNKEIGNGRTWRDAAQQQKNEVWVSGVHFASRQQIVIGIAKGWQMAKLAMGFEFLVEAIIPPGEYFPGNCFASIAGWAISGEMG